MSKLTSLIRRAPKRFSAVALMLAAAIIIPTASMAWGPNRETFTLDQPSDHVQFNSITDNTAIGGDERDFVSIRDASAENVWYDSMNVQSGKEYVVRMYVHNNAATSLGLVAENVTAKVNLPTTTGKSIQVNGFVSASNVGANKTGNAGTYAEVYDHATFTGSENFNLAYVAGSLKYENNVLNTALPESIFTTAGAKLGYDKLDGKIPGCFQYSGFVSFKVKPQFATPTKDFTVSKEVRKEGGKFAETVAATAGEKLNYRIVYTNTGSSDANDVMLKDTMPKGVTYVPGSVKILNAANPASAYVKDGDKLFTSGINIGQYTPTSNALVIFDAIVDGVDTLPQCGTNTLQNRASAQPSGLNPKDDTANVTVDKTCAPVVAYTCDSLAVSRISRTEFKFTTAYTVKNATFKNVTYIIRDANGAEVERKTSTAKTLDYTRNTVGKYTVEAIITVSVDGQDKTISSANCKKEFEVPKTPVEYCPIPGKEQLPKDSKDCVETPVTPPVTPPELPHTGASENILAFTGLGALIASISYYVASRRALNL